MNRFLFPAALALAVALAGCVGSGGIDGINDSKPDVTGQQVEVHAILDHREVAGVGCLLENDAGRWFVVAPGRVTVARSSQALAVSCKRDGVGSADESWSAHHQSGRLVGKILFSAGLRDYLPNGYAYPNTLTVTMRAARPGEGEGAASPGTPIF
jgi:hypothetical protein